MSDDAGQTPVAAPDPVKALALANAIVERYRERLRRHDTLATRLGNAHATQARADLDAEKARVAYAQKYGEDPDLAEYAIRQIERANAQKQAPPEAEAAPPAP